MTKYIIKNCENCYYYEDDGYYCEFQKDNIAFVNPCKESDCLLKQIVKKCKKKAELLDYTAIDILSMLEIQECE